MRCSTLEPRRFTQHQRTHLIGLASPAVFPILIIALHYGFAYHSHHQVHGVAIISIPLDGRMNKSNDHHEQKPQPSTQQQQPIQPPGNRSAVDDVNNDTHIFTSDTFPSLDELQPTLANGHLGFTVFGDTVFMNGLFNGLRGLSHRARVPNWANIRIGPCNGESDCRSEFRLNVRLGTFEEERWYGNRYRVVHRIYAHRFHDRAIINEFRVYRLDQAGVVNVPLRRLHRNASSEDIDFEPAIGLSNHHELTVRCGHTKVAEDADFGKNRAISEDVLSVVDEVVDGDNNNNQMADEKQPVCVLWNHVPKQIRLMEDLPVTSTRFVMTVDAQRRVAEHEMIAVLRLSDEELFSRHAYEWNTFWSEFRISIGGDLDLSRAIDASIFYLVSSMPSTNTNLPPNPAGGLSPTGLPKGGDRLNDYEGHSMWDTETWMFPVLLFMNPAWTENLIEYRFNRLDAARKFARASGYRGARFPWESAHTGRDVTQPCCPVVASQQVHISADIAFAVRNHFAATGDTDWMAKTGCTVAHEVAEFWASRVTFNYTTQKYDITDVMGPDEDHNGVSNNAYTNVAAGLALYFADYATCICNNYSNSTLPTNPTDFSSIAAHLKLPQDDIHNYTPQFDGYTRGTIIKQADTVLLGYPLLYKALPPTVYANNVDYYEQLTRDSGPAMTWSMHSINRLQLTSQVEQESSSVHQKQQADVLFRRGYRGYIRSPFMVWNEVLPTEPTGAVNFLTGAGGFLQSVLNGYAGLKLRLDGLYIERPQLPEGVQFISTLGIRFYGTKFRLYIERDKHILLTSLAPMPIELVLHLANGSYMKMIEQKSYDITHSNVTRISSFVDSYTTCSLPNDIIGLPIETNN